MWCGDQDFEDDADWYYKKQEDYSVCDAQDATCFSCGKKIEQGATCVRFERWRYPTEEEYEQGMEWELDHHACDLLSDLGVSNVIREDPARIECHTGCVVAYVFS